MSRITVLHRVLGCLLFVCLTTNQPIRAAESHRYIDPIVYVGEDGNLYMTDIARSATTRLTTPTDTRSGSSRFGSVRWSPDGSQFLVVEHPISRYEYSHEPHYIVWLFHSGGNREQLPIKIKLPVMLSWSPNGDRFAYGANWGDADIPAYLTSDYSIKVYILGSKSNTSKEVGTITPQCSGDGYGYPPEHSLLQSIEKGGQPFGKPDFVLVWTAFGILGGNAGCNGLAMWDSSGNLIWSDHEIDDVPIVSTDRKRAIVENKYLDLSNGMIVEMEDLRSLSSGQLLSWTDDQEVILYTTLNEREIETEAENPVSEAIFGSWIGVWDSQIQLVDILLGSTKQPQILYDRRGYAVGSAQVTPDSSAVVFSFITSSYEQAKAINEGKLEAEVRQIPGAYIELVAVSLNTKTPEVLWTERGGQPAIGKGEFIAVER